MLNGWNRRSTKSFLRLLPQYFSKNKDFKNINPQKDILEKLDTLKLGYLPKRRQRVAFAKRMDETEKTGTAVVRKSRPKIFPFHKKGKVVLVAGRSYEIPESFDGQPPEIAIIGRSNVGKSSLMNALVGFDSSYVQKSSVSDKPGETTQIHFYQIGERKIPTPPTPAPAPTASDMTQPVTSTNNPSNVTVIPLKEKKPNPPDLIIADLPGYGFAFRKESAILESKELCVNYLLGINKYNPFNEDDNSSIKKNSRRKNLKRVLLLLDARHGLKIGDKEYFQSLFTTFNEINETARINKENDNDNEGKRKWKKHLELKKNLKYEKEMTWKLQIVLTKCDLVDRLDLARRIQILKQSLKDLVPTEMKSVLWKSLSNQEEFEKWKALQLKKMKLTNQTVDGETKPGDELPPDEIELEDDGFDLALPIMMTSSKESKGIKEIQQQLRQLLPSIPSHPFDPSHRSTTSPDDPLSNAKKRLSHSERNRLKRLQQYPTGPVESYKKKVEEFQKFKKVGKKDKVHSV